MFQAHCTAVYFIYRVWSAAWNCQGPGDRASSFQVPHGTGLERTGVPRCHPRAGAEGRAGFQPLLCFMGLQGWWQQALSHQIPSPLQHPWIPGCSKGFPSNMGMLAWLWSRRAEGRGLAVGRGRFWGARSLGMTPGSRSRSRLEGSAGPRALGAWPCSLCVCTVETEL